MLQIAMVVIINPCVSTGAENSVSGKTWEPPLKDSNNAKLCEALTLHTRGGIQKKYLSKHV